MTLALTEPVMNPARIDSPIDRLVVINDTGVADGGAAALALAAAIGMRRRGVPVTFITAEGPVDAALTQAGVDIVAIPGTGISTRARIQGFAVGLYRPQAAKRMARWIEANDTPRTIYHLHNWAHFLSPAVLGVLARVHKRLVITAHDHFLVCGNGAQFSFTENRACPRRANSVACLTHNCDRRSYADKLWRVARHHVSRQMFDFTALDPRVLAIHAGTVAALENGGIPPEMLRVVANPIRAWVGSRIPAERNANFLFVGRLSHEKGPDIAAAAAARAGVGVDFVGNGPLLSHLQNLYPQARFHGWLDQAGIAAVASKARALVMPGRWAEPFGLVAGEALWSGLPVIISDNANLAGAISESGSGIAVDRTVDAVAEALGRIAGDHDLTRRMSVAAFEQTRHIGNTFDDWLDAQFDVYRERLDELRQLPRPVPFTAVPSHRHGPSGMETRRAGLRLFNLRYSPNIGDGLLAVCLEQALADELVDSTSVDLAGRTRAGVDLPGRGALLALLQRLPIPLRHAAVRLPLALLDRLKWRPHYNAALTGAAGVVIGGGNLLTDHDFNFPTKIRAAVRMAERHSLPFAVHSVGVASQWSERGRSMVRKALSSPLFRGITVRDQASLDAWNRHFADAVGHSASLARDPGLLASRFFPVSQRVRGRTLGINLMSPVGLCYHTGRKSEVSLDDWYLRLIVAAQSRGWHVVIFTNGGEEDRQYLPYLQHRIQNFDAIAPVGSFQFEDVGEYCRQVAGLDALVSFRLHALIVATSYGIAVAALDWDEKVRSFMASIERSSQFFRHERDAPDAVLAAVERAWQTGDDLRRREMLLDEAASAIADLARMLKPQD